MDVSIVYGFTCPACSCPALGEMFFFAVHVNKGSLRTRGRGLGFIPRRCGECGADFRVDGAAMPDSAWIHGEDREKLNAARARKGWPPLTDWRVVAKSPTKLDTPS